MVKFRGEEGLDYGGIARVSFKNIEIMMNIYCNEIYFDLLGMASFVIS